MAQLRFDIVPARALDDAVRLAADAVGFPCVIKAVSLSAGQGILCADDAADAVTAAAGSGTFWPLPGTPENEPLLVEEYLSGLELSIDGLLADGNLTPVAIFDNP